MHFNSLDHVEIGHFVFRTYNHSEMGLNPHLQMWESIKHFTNLVTAQASHILWIILDCFKSWQKHYWYKLIKLMYCIRNIKTIISGLRFEHVTTAVSYLCTTATTLCFSNQIIIEIVLTKAGNKILVEINFDHRVDNFLNIFSRMLS